MTGRNDGGDVEKQGSDSEGGHDDMLSIAEATAAVRRLRERQFGRVGTENVRLEEITGRVVAEPITAPVALPEHSHATMDGYAFDATEGYPYELAGETFPEDEPPSINSGEAIRIFTGAPLPPSANAVLKQETAAVTDQRLTGPPIEPGTYVYERGSNVPANETLFRAGERFGPQDALLLGDLGINSLSVRRRLSVGLLATGTEIHEGQMNDLDSPMLSGLVQAWGARPAYEGTVPDEFSRVRNRIAALADEHDVVITTGGTSVGKKDYVVRALSELGDVLFHRVRLRPGKPIAVAELESQEAVVFAIPGKPVGAHAVTALVAGPFFTGRQELPTVTAQATHNVELPTTGFTYAIPVSLSEGAATPLGHVDSALSVYDETVDPSVLSSSTRATRADGYAVTQSPVSAGDQLTVATFPALER